MALFNIQRFKNLPPRPGVIWQGGLFRMPGWIKDESGKPFRPRVALWVSSATGLVSHPHLLQPDEDPYRVALEAALEFGLSAEGGMGRPDALEVKAAELAE